MQRILITGGRGVLGRRLVKKLKQTDYHIQIAGRKKPDKPDAFWLPLDLKSGKGISEAVEGVDLVFHLASATRKFDSRVDIEGTQALVKAAKTAGVKHFVYISIVGIDKIPFRYYRYKLEAEFRIQESGLPFTILRATQFHEFLDEILHSFTRAPVCMLPKRFQFQPIAAEEVAEKLMTYLDLPPLNALTQVGGPEVMELGEMAKIWIRARGLNRWVLPMPVFGKTADAFKKGYNTSKEHRTESKTWEDWVKEKYRGRK